jgi:3,5-epimerase/4-reductase
VADQDKILKARRSNNELDTTKITTALPDVPIMNIHESCEKVFQRMRVNLEAEGIWPDRLPRRTPPPSS